MDKPKISSTERVADCLRRAGHADTIAAFPEGTRTAADAAAAIGCSVAQIAKSLIFRCGDRPLLVVASGANRVDPEKLRILLGGPVDKADPTWVRDTTGFAIGGVAPVGCQGDPIVLLDEDLFSLDPIWAAAGSPSHVFKTTARDLARLSGAQIASVKE